MYMYQTWNWVIGSPGEWVIWVIILTRCETLVFPVFEKIPKMQNVYLKCWNDESHCQVSVVGLKSLDVSSCNELLLKILWPENFFGVHYRTGSPGQLGLRVAGFPGHCRLVSQNWSTAAAVSYLLIIHTHPFNGPFSGTTQVSRYQKGKTNLYFTEARDSEWQWLQLGHVKVCKITTR